MIESRENDWQAIIWNQKKKTRRASSSHWKFLGRFMIACQKLCLIQCQRLWQWTRMHWILSSRKMQARLRGGMRCELISGPLFLPVQSVMKFYLNMIRSWQTHFVPINNSTLHKIMIVCWKYNVQQRHLTRVFHRIKLKYSCVGFPCLKLSRQPCFRHTSTPGYRARAEMPKIIQRYKWFNWCN